MRFCIRFAHTISYGQHVLLSRNADLLNILFTSKEMYRLGKEVYYGSNTFTLRANPSTIFFKRRRMAVTRAMRKLDFSLRIGVGASDLEYLVKLEESGDAAPRDQVPPRKDNEEMLRVSAMAKTHWQKLFPRLTLLRINVTLECCGVGWALGNIGVKEKARVRPRSVEVVVVSEWSRCGGKCKKTVKGVIKSMFRLRTEE
ncbi:hypothetical protein BU23DRAFT_267170 [Bimuria novae-zelandiae CBS 107.79]|uniref:Uncharacterized protein n=1 Tax=Bimuria novae-zelandiae CBS 107.79 TaxID=1447943 RepID=A0A6A5V4J4_9PLEO|nr:hypothetical protein BU23DRAFT_267170 [Bimuria novae-zelandiae CBS 107.79]